MTFHCLLVVLALCQALHDRPVLVMGGVQTAVVSYDITQTRIRMSTGLNYENDPLARPFVNSNAASAVLGASELLASAYIAEKMRRSEYAVLRKTWWLSEAIPIAGHVWGIATSRGPSPAALPSR